MTLEHLQEHDQLLKDYIDGNSSTTTFDMLCEMYDVYSQETEESDGTTKITEEVKDGETIKATRTSILSADLNSITETTTIGTVTQTRVITINESAGTVSAVFQS